MSCGTNRREWYCSSKGLINSQPGHCQSPPQAPHTIRCSFCSVIVLEIHAPLHRAMVGRSTGIWSVSGKAMVLGTEQAQGRLNSPSLPIALKCCYN